ncbi:hypothetical protein F2P81_007348 [Scophthalmus maximus]|uniref:Uncharacterized protein n=1 Tax=Scophthalmus maximus TaxID=52904 RepID=A0A6A4TCA8_SCOMX|nr:hypothetical protein F2P81_007348 [Scophthalmus maximus]
MDPSALENVFPFQSPFAALVICVTAFCQGRFRKRSDNETYQLMMYTDVHKCHPPLTVASVIVPVGAHQKGLVIRDEERVGSHGIPALVLHSSAEIVICAFSEDPDTATVKPKTILQHEKKKKNKRLEHIASTIFNLD